MTKKPTPEEVLQNRRLLFEQMLTVFKMEGFEPNEEFLADMELLLAGKMSPEEHREYLKKKYKK